MEPKLAQDEKRLSITESIAWNSIGNFVYLFAQWLLTYIVVRLLGYESAGILSLAISVGTSFSTVALYTMRNYQTSDIDEAYSACDYVSSRFFTCGLSLLLCVLFTFANSYDAYMCACIIMFMLFKVSEAMSDVFQGILQKRNRMDYVGISFALRGIVCLVLFATAILIFNDLLSAITLLCVSSFALVFLYDYQHAKVDLNGGSKSIQSIKSLLIVCFPVAMYGILINTGAQLPRYFIELLMGAEQLGYYTSVAMPVVIVQVAANFIFAPLVTPLAVNLNRGNYKGFLKLVIRTLIFIGALAALSFIGFAVAGEWLLVLLFGDSINTYVYLLNPLILCVVLTALAWFLGTILTILRQLKALLVSSAVMFAIAAFGSIPFIESFGLNGATFVLICALIIFIFCSSLPIAIYFRRVNNGYSGNSVA